jgi:hypothetical protein
MKERPRFYTTVLTDHLKKYRQMALVAVSANACHSRFVFSLCPSAAATNAAIIAGIGS